MKHLARYILILTFFLGCVGYCFAQNSKQQPGEIVTARPSPEYDSKSWKEFSSKEGQFNVLFPATPTEQTQIVDSPFGKLLMHLFILKTFGYYEVAYVDFPATDGIKDIKAYFNGVREGVLRGTQAQLLEEKDDYHFAIPGRYFKTQLPNGLINRVNLYFARNRSYLISIALPEKNADAESLKFYEGIATKFLSSFKIVPDIDAAKGDRFGDPIGAKPLAPPSGGGIDVDPVLSNGKNPEPFANVSGGILNGKAISLPKPVYSSEASGEVTVKIVFDESGNVIWAKAVSGPQLLYAVAEEAALKAKFQPVSLQGKPVKVSGFLLYKFVH